MDADEAAEECLSLLLRFLHLSAFIRVHPRLILLLFRRPCICLTLSLMPHVGRLLEPAVVERLNQLQLTARSVVEGTTAGQHRSPLKGASVEFRQHRIYVPGDEPRRLDWRGLGRTDRPYIKEYDQETNLRCAILLDRSGSMAYAGTSEQATSKFDYASKLAAALAYLMLAQTESVGLGVFGRSI